MPHIANLESVWNHLKNQNIDLEVVCIHFEMFAYKWIQFKIFSRILNPQKNMAGYQFSVVSCNRNPIYCQQNFLMRKLFLSSYQSVRFSVKFLKICSCFIKISIFSVGPFSHEDSVHMQMLYTLFNKLTGLNSPAALGTHWEIIGFQASFISRFMFHDVQHGI